VNGPEEIVITSKWIVLASIRPLKMFCTCASSWPPVAFKTGSVNRVDLDFLHETSVSLLGLQTPTHFQKILVVVFIPELHTLPIVDFVSALVSDVVLRKVGGDGGGLDLHCMRKSASAKSVGVDGDFRIGVFTHVLD